MPCFHPLSAAMDGGRAVFTNLDRYAPSARLTLPCGRCHGCRLERSRQWAVRLMHELKTHHGVGVFITLTYSDEYLPSGGTLVPEDMQKFMKRLRKWHQKSCMMSQRPVNKLSYYLCGEYGDETHRPHYHLCLFGCDFAADKKRFKSSSSGSDLYDSDSLTRLWSFGYANFGEITFESAAYVARYSMKKITGDLAKSHYTRVSPDGEIIELVPEFARMSLKPAIGKRFFENFHSDIYPHDHVISRGLPAKPPRYYDNRLRVMNEPLYDELKSERKLAALASAFDNRPARLLVKEQVSKAAISLKKRSI